MQVTRTVTRLDKSRAGGRGARLALREARRPGDFGRRGECGARARRLVTVALGRLGHHPAGTTTGVRGASLDWDRRGAGNARGEARGLRPPVGAGLQDRTLRPGPRKHGLTLSLGDQLSPWREPQWNADRRARFARRAPYRKVRRDTCVCRRSASFFFLSFFSFFFFFLFLLSFVAFVPRISLRSSGLQGAASDRDESGRSTAGLI